MVIVAMVGTWLAAQTPRELGERHAARGRIGIRSPPGRRLLPQRREKARDTGKPLRDQIQSLHIAMAFRIVDNAQQRWP